MDLPASISKLIDGRQATQETLTTDFKWYFGIESKAEKKEFAKDVVALANTLAAGEDEAAYLVLGIRDARDRRAPAEKRFRPRGNQDDVLAFGRQLQDIVNSYCRPAPNISYRECSLPRGGWRAMARRLWWLARRLAGGNEHLQHGSGAEAVGLVTIGRALSYPVRMVMRGEQTVEHVAYIRAGGSDPGRRVLNDEECERLRWVGFGEGQSDRLVLERLDHLESLVKARDLFSVLTGRDAAARRDALREVSQLHRASSDDRRHQAQVVTGMLWDDDDTVIWEAIGALRAIGDPVGVDGLFQLCDTRLQSKRDVLLFDAVATIGDLCAEQAALPRLLEMGRAFPTPGSSEQLNEEFAQVVNTAIDRILSRQSESQTGSAGIEGLEQ